MVFDAGEIRAALAVSRDQFNRDLDQAKADVDRFTKDPYQVKLGATRDELTRELRQAKADGDEWARKTYEAKISADGKPARDTFDDLLARKDALTKDPATIKVKVDGGAAASTELDKIELKKAAISRGSATVKVDTDQASRNVDSLSQKLSGLSDKMKEGSGPAWLGPAIGLLPAATSLIGAATGAAAGLGGAFVTAGAAAGAFAVVAKSVLTQAATASTAAGTAQTAYTAAVAKTTGQYQAAMDIAKTQAQRNSAYAAEQKGFAADRLAETAALTKAYAGMSTQQIALSKQLGDIKAGWQAVKAAETPVIAGALQPWLQTVTPLLHDLAPMIAAVAPVIHDLGAQMNGVVTSAGFQGFLNLIEGTGTAGVKAIGSTIIDLIDSFITLLPQFQPLIDDADRGIADFGTNVLAWSHSQKAADDITSFIGWFTLNGPVAWGLIKNLAGAIAAISPGLSAGGVEEMRLLSDLLAVVAALPKGVAGPIEEIVGALLLASKLGVLKLGVQLVGLGGKALSFLSGGSITLGGVSAAAQIEAALTTGGAAAAAEIRAAMATGGLGAGAELGAGEAAGGLLGGGEIAGAMAATSAGVLIAAAIGIPLAAYIVARIQGAIPPAKAAANAAAQAPGRQNAKTDLANQNPTQQPVTTTMKDWYDNQSAAFKKANPWSSTTGPTQQISTAYRASGAPQAGLGPAAPGLTSYGPAKSALPDSAFTPVPSHFASGPTQVKSSIPSGADLAILQAYAKMYDTTVPAAYKVFEDAGVKVGASLTGNSTAAKDNASRVSSVQAAYLQLSSKGLSTKAIDDYTASFRLNGATSSLTIRDQQALVAQLVKSGLTWQQATAEVAGMTAGTARNSVAQQILSASIGAGKATRAQLITDLLAMGTKSSVATPLANALAASIKLTGTNAQNAAAARKNMISDLESVGVKAPVATTDTNNLASAVKNHGTTSSQYQSARARLIQDFVNAGVDAQTAKGLVDGLTRSVQGIPAQKTIGINVTGKGTWSISQGQALQKALIAGTKFAGAAGGILPGYAPGQDSLLAAVSPGEAILVPEAVRAIGAGNILGWNRYFAGGRTSQGMAFAGGGIVGGATAPPGGNGNFAGLGPWTTTQYDSTCAAMAQSVADAMTGAINTAVSAAVAAAAGGTPGHVTAGVSQWRGLVAQALAMEGLSASLVNNVLYQMQTESGGNQAAINLTDSNAAAGHPSKGLMQVIAGTFAAYHWPGTSGNIYDPLANIAAAINYADHTYGPNLANQYGGIGSGHGYDSGGWLQPGTTLAVNNTGRPELVISGDQLDALSKGGPGGRAGGQLAGTINIMLPEGGTVADAFSELTFRLRAAQQQSWTGGNPYG